GKRDEDLVLPLNDSISFTLSQKEMRAKTTVMISPNFSSDRIWINGREESATNPRIKNCLKEVRRRAGKRKYEDDDDDEDTSLPINWHVHICSENNFPTAAGLASSAAGYACLGKLCISPAVMLMIEGNISTIARLGSGSACRSLDGGLVHWHKGEKEDGSDSYAEQIAPPDHWPDLHVIICVAIKTKDWSSFCDLTMADSNEMHAVALNTFPPCVYMNDTSHAIADFVHQYNAIKIKEEKEEQKICYTFDAGPNACLFIPGKVIEEVSILLPRCFPASNSNSVNISKNNPYWQASLTSDVLISGHDSGYVVFS
ncbi:Diphosphomevalonate decarboxylase, partial [Armadillidium nasatum]